MAGEIEAIKHAILRAIEGLGEARSRIDYREYNGKGGLIVAFNSHILPELCIKLLRILPEKGELDEASIADQIIEYHKRLGTVYLEAWPRRKLKFHKKLREFTKEEDLLGVIYMGLTFEFDVKAYEIVRNLNDGYLVYITNKWRETEDVMEACILAATIGERVILCAIFWYPVLGIIKARATNFNQRIPSAHVESVVSEVLGPMKEILLERIEYEKRPPEEESEEFLEDP